MNTKIIPFYGRHYKRNKYPPLTSKMIVALLASCEKQHAGIPYGPKDIKGSFTSLIRRGLVIRKKLTLNGKTDFYWRVNTTAIEMLMKLGLTVDC
jgi:hypothetical protein